MTTQIRDVARLQKILWLDYILGGGTATIGLMFYEWLTRFLGLPQHLIIIISVITLLYAVLAFYLARQASPPVTLLRILIYANWLWTLISVGFILYYFSEATIFGGLFLVLQVVVVGLLAFFEGRELQ